MQPDRAGSGLPAAACSPRPPRLLMTIGQCVCTDPAGVGGGPDTEASSRGHFPGPRLHSPVRTWCVSSLAWVSSRRPRAWQSLTQSQDAWPGRGPRPALARAAPGLCPASLSYLRGPVPHGTTTRRAGRGGAHRARTRPRPRGPPPTEAGRLLVCPVPGFQLGSAARTELRWPSAWPPAVPLPTDPGRAVSPVLVLQNLPSLLW